jgi:hypothetical protein
MRSALLLVLLLAPACKLVSTAANVPGEIATGLTGGKKSATKLPTSLLHAGIMRFSDTFAARVNEATQEFADRVATPDARIQGMSWAIRQTTAAYTIATGPNANIALLDMIVLVSLNRMVHEEYLLPKVWGEADRPMLLAFQALEADVWNVASQILTSEQQQALRDAMQSWRQENPDLAATAFVRLPAFRDIFKIKPEDSPQKSGGLGDLLSVDPLAGLEPAVREIEQTRQFGERTMFYLQRAPLILSAQIELMGLKLAQRPEVQSALQDSQRISQAAARIADTAEKLPESLARMQEPASKVLTDARSTLDAAAQMSTALQGAIASLDKFVGRFDEKPPAAGAAPPAPAEPGKPFDVAEYGEAAAKIGASAKELNGLVTNLDQTLPRVQETMDHAFARGFELGGLLLAIAAAAVLLVRWISGRYFAAGRRAG